MPEDQEDFSPWPSWATCTNVETPPMPDRPGYHLWLSCRRFRIHFGKHKNINGSRW